MTDVNKAIKPVESLVIAPLNEGALYKANNFILFRIGASNMNMWLTNSSYLTLDIEYTGQTVSGYSTQTKACPTYIRNACNLFSQIEVQYGGDTIYSQPYNIEQNTIKQLYYGEDYLSGNYATYTTREMVVKDMYDTKGARLMTGINTHLKFDNNTASSNTLKDTTIHNVMIPINQLIPLFMDMGSEGFPVRCLKQQIEIRLYIAEPYRYLVDWNPVTKDFDYRLFLDDATTMASPIAASVKQRYPEQSIKLSNVKMFCQHYLPDASLAARIDNEALNSTDGMNWQFTRHEIAMRQVSQINKTNNLPFTATTENTQSLLLYCHRTGYSPGLMYRPNISSLYISFGSNQLPFQPIPGSTYSSPFEYKFLTDDTLNCIDTYFSQNNHDYNSSYKYIEDVTTEPDTTDMKVPSSTFVLMAANYVSDPSALGSPSSLWSAQYQVHFNAPYIDSTKRSDTSGSENPSGLTFILGVESKWGLTLQNGKLTAINI